MQTSFYYWKTAYEAYASRLCREFFAEKLFTLDKLHGEAYASPRALFAEKLFTTGKLRARLTLSRLCWEVLRKSFFTLDELRGEAYALVPLRGFETSCPALGGGEDTSLCAENTL